MHYVLTVAPTAMVCIEMAAVSRLDTSLEVLGLVHRLKRLSKGTKDSIEFYTEWGGKGFCIVSMLKRFCRLCYARRNDAAGEDGHAERRSQALRIVAFLEGEGLTEGGDVLMLRPLCTWLQEFAKQGAAGPSGIPAIPAAFKHGTRRDSEWDQPEEELLHLYLPPWNKSL